MISAWASCCLAFERADDKRPPLQIDLGHIIGDDPRAEVDGLLPHQLHQLRTGDGMLSLVDVHVLQPFGVDRGFEKCCKSPAGKPA